MSLFGSGGVSVTLPETPFFFSFGVHEDKFSTVPLDIITRGDMNLVN